MDPIEVQEKIERLDELLKIGPNDIYLELIDRYTFLDKNKCKIIGIKTVADPDSDKEMIYIYQNGVYVRGESTLKADIERIIRATLDYCGSIIEDLEAVSLSQDKGQKILQLKAVLEKKKHAGVLTSTVGEVLNMVRRNTYTSRDEMNPDGFIPFKNGILNLATAEFQPPTPVLFFTWRINANYLNRPIDPAADFPLFLKFLYQLVPPEYVLPLLFYYAYATLHPGFPAHKTLWLVGRQRIGKGASIRLLHLLNPEGAGTISLAKILNNDLKFDLYSIVDKNYVTDSEMQRIRVKNGGWDAFNKIFGGDIVDIEGKYRQKYAGRLKCKAVFAGNLPIVKIESPATVERIVLVQTRNNAIPPEERVPNIEQTIFAKEGDAIATYFVHLLKILITMNFIFPERIKINDDGEIVLWKEMDFDEKTQILDMLSDPVKAFIEERTAHFSSINNYAGDGNVPVDEVYDAFVEWCKEKGIVPLVKQTFVKKFGSEYPKKRVRIDGKRTYVFDDLVLLEKEGDRPPSTLGQPPIPGKDTQDTHFDDIECLSQLLSIKLIGEGEGDNNSNKVYTMKLGQQKNHFKVITGLTFRCKNWCPNLFEGQIESKSEESEIENKKDLKYFKSEMFYSSEYFEDLGVVLIDHFTDGGMHYYAIDVPETLTGEQAYRFSSMFSIKAYPITEGEFNKNKGELHK
ncbi:MAG: DNA primase family protein [Thermoplasmata archaeon]